MPPPGAWLLGGVAQLLFMLWAGTRDGLRLRIVAWPRWTPEIKEFFKAFGAVTFGAASVVIAPLIDTFIASFLPVGSRTALYYADRINQLPLGVLGIALGTVLLPEMSTRLAKGDRAGSDAAQNRSAAMTLLLTLPFCRRLSRDTGHHHARRLRAWRLRPAGGGAFGGWRWRPMASGLPAMALVRIVASTFYARHDTMTPARATVTAIVCNIVLKIVFVWGLHLGVAGVALGTALGAWINVAILTWSGRSRALLAIETTFVRALPPALLAALADGAGAWLGAMLGEMAMPGALRGYRGAGGGDDLRRPGLWRSACFCSARACRWAGWRDEAVRGACRFHDAVAQASC